MSSLSIKNHRVIAKPDCCGTCKWNQWNEYGCHCTNDKNWKLDQGETKISREDVDYDDYIDWHNICDNYEKGLTFE